MTSNQTKRYKNQGQVMLVLVILFMLISLIVIFGVVNPTLRNIRIASSLISSKQSLFLSDSGVADAIYRIKNNFEISTQEVLSLNSGTATTSIIELVDGKEISSLGDYSDYIRNIKVKLSKGVGTSFFYGVQTGQGGFEMAGNSQVNGNIYSNGPISGGVVTGTAISATSTTVGIRDSKIGTGGVGDAWAHTINSTTVEGALKCQTGTSNNKNCNTSYADPEPIEMPISAEQIAEWKGEAEAGQVIIGNYGPNDSFSLGPVKITGDFDVKRTVTMTGTIWVEGKLSFANTNSQILLSTSTYGTKSGVIIVDKYTTFSGGSQILSTGATSSYVMLLLTSDCPESSFCSGKPAISASGGAGSVVLAAPYGTIDFSGNSNARGVIANKVKMGGSTVIDYEFGLANLNFVSGPTGGYHILDFRETE